MRLTAGGPTCARFGGEPAGSATSNGRFAIVEVTLDVVLRGLEGIDKVLYGLRAVRRGFRANRTEERVGERRQERAGSYGELRGWQQKWHRQSLKTEPRKVKGWSGVRWKKPGHYDGATVDFITVFLFSIGAPSQSCDLDFKAEESTSYVNSWGQYTVLRYLPSRPPSGPDAPGHRIPQH